MLDQEACVDVPDRTGAFTALSVAVVEGVLLRDDVDLCDLKGCVLGSHEGSLQEGRAAGRVSAKA